MNLNLKRFVLFLSVFVFLSTGVVLAGGDLPCVLPQVDRSFFASGEEVRVHLASGRSNCPAPPLVEMLEEGLVISDEIWFSLERWEARAARWEQVGEQWRVNRRPVGSGLDKRELVTSPRLDAGSYKLTAKQAIEGGFLSTVRFDVGEVARPSGCTPYVQSSGIVAGGHLYFRGDLCGAAAAAGYLYQVREEDRTEILPVVFEQVPQDASEWTNQPFIRGGTLDLPWVRVRLSNNSFDPGRPVLAAPTVNGITVNGVAYDPRHPIRHFLGFSPSR
ncbi:MAG: hypothetical protein HY609_06800 [Deltaproteobacteria bacterium]|nr:hypothetical protein [Candidatus Doudnabacteria bacterium]MBI4224628.1 hypothetical protein [Deltaproteobacteria bacterium]